MLQASIWTSTNATILRDALVNLESEFLSMYRLNQFTMIQTDHILKLEGYILVHESPTTITVNTNGHFEVYIDNIQLMKSDNSSSIDYYQTGIFPFECYIKPSSVPLSYELNPNQFTLNNGYIVFENPRSMTSKTIKITFANPVTYIRQKYYIGDTELEVTYSDSDTDNVKLTETTVTIPPE